MDPAEIKEINESYFNAVIFEALMRGIHIAVLISALRTIYKSPRSNIHSRFFLTVIVLALFILATADLGAFWAYVRRAFIAHGETSSSIADALNEYPTWFTAMISFSDANATLADCVIIWRTWIVWSRSWKIIVIPVICTLLTVAFSIIAIYQTVMNTTFGVLWVDYATALYSTTLTTTIFCTGAIIFRVIKIGGYRPYHNIIEILVESAALYSVATLFALIAYIVSGPASEYAAAFWTACTGIAPTLVIARAAAGQAKPKPWDTNDETNSATVLPRFNKSVLPVATSPASSETRASTYDPVISGSTTRSMASDEGRFKVNKF